MSSQKVQGCELTVIDCRWWMARKDSWIFRFQDKSLLLLIGHQFGL